MAQINKLTPVDIPSLSDLIPIWSQQNGRACETSILNLAKVIQLYITTNPLPDTTPPEFDAPFSGAIPMEAGVPQAAQRSVIVIGSLSGSIIFTLFNASTIEVPFNAGFNSYPFSATQFDLDGGAVTAVYNMIQPA